jgi:hypothetical protein
VEWFGDLWLQNGVPCIPAEALMAAFVGGAKVLKQGPQAAAGLAVEHDAALFYDGPKDINKLWESGEFLFRAAVKVGVHSKTMRTRPCFKDWQAEFTASYLPSIIDRDWSKHSLRRECEGIGRLAPSERDVRSETD